MYIYTYIYVYIYIYLAIKRGRLRNHLKIMFFHVKSIELKNHGGSSSRGADEGSHLDTSPVNGLVFTGKS